MLSSKLLINKLKQIDLSAYPSNQVEELILMFLKSLGKLPTRLFTLHQGHEIIRIRPNSSIEEVFSKKEELSFKPQEFNKTYQRASTPNATMFYGSLMPTEKDDILSRLVCSFEGLPWLRDKTSFGKQKVTFSKWVVSENVNLIPIIYEPKFYNNRLVSSSLEEATKFIKDNAPVQFDDIMSFYSFIGEEFSKEVINQDYNYLISAIFTDILIKGFRNKIDGVAYPSCRVAGEGTNVALTTNAATNKLKMIAVGECMVYKFEETILLDNLTIAFSSDGSSLTHFSLSDVPSELNVGEAKCLHELGVTDLPYRK